MVGRLGAQARWSIRSYRFWGTDMEVVRIECSIADV